jgi:hypothetical protein
MIKKANFPGSHGSIKTVSSLISLTVDVESHGSFDDYEFAKILDDLLVKSLPDCQMSP